MSASDQKPRICIVEDDGSLRGELAHLLELQGYQPCAYEPEDGLFSAAAAFAVEQDADCAIIDLKLPDISGHIVCRDIRAASDMPIIILTSSDSEFDEVMGMGFGADDYITKPYSPAVLLAHLQSVLRRASKASSSHQLHHKGATLDMASGNISYGEETTELTRNEQRILRLLMENPGCVITRQEMMRTLWESDEFIDDNTLTVNINRLRKKLSSIGLAADFLMTKRGQGYII